MIIYLRRSRAAPLLIHSPACSRLSTSAPSERPCGLLVRVMFGGRICSLDTDLLGVVDMHFRERCMSARCCFRHPSHPPRSSAPGTDPARCWHFASDAPPWRLPPFACHTRRPPPLVRPERIGVALLVAWDLRRVSRRSAAGLRSRWIPWRLPVRVHVRLPVLHAGLGLFEDIVRRVDPIAAGVMPKRRPGWREWPSLGGSPTGSEWPSQCSLPA